MHLIELRTDAGQKKFTIPNQTWPNQTWPNQTWANQILPNQILPNLNQPNAEAHNQTGALSGLPHCLGQLCQITTKKGTNFSNNCEGTAKL